MMQQSACNTAVGFVAGSIGVAEVLGGKAARQDDVAALQGDDLLALGQLMLQLLCGTAHHPSIEHCAAYFSPELTHIVASLLGQSQTPFTSWHQVKLCVSHDKSSSPFPSCLQTLESPTGRVISWSLSCELCSGMIWLL